MSTRSNTKKENEKASAMTGNANRVYEDLNPQDLDFNKHKKSAMVSRLIELSS